MKNYLIFAIVLFPLCVFSNEGYVGYNIKNDCLEIQLSSGKLNIIPLTHKAIRVQWLKNDISENQELVLVNIPDRPKFKIVERDSLLILTTDELKVCFNKKTAALHYLDKEGNVFLEEGDRLLQESSVEGQPCFIAEQSFKTKADERLFGLGQFQDGHFNLLNVSRKLIQVNTQIAVPFLYSSKGYGILWHQYGITNFNPADSKVSLSKSNSSSGGKGEVEVTTTAGTQKVSQQQSLYTGKFSITKPGAYTFMLDYGNMESRHLLVIDGKPYIDQSNLWLPPAASKIINLEAGEHTVEIVGKSANVPSLSWKPANNETKFSSPNAKSLDYVVFHGSNADEVIYNYRQLSGEVPMLPKWAFGFWQCRERYTSGSHLVETVKEFRRRRLPVDVIVQDWQYWGKYGWGVPKFDEAHYPDPEKFINKLHELNARFSISVWENLDKKSSVAKEYVDNNLYIPNSQWIDIFNPKTQQTHWNALNKNLFSLGVDSWWMDATEPENDALTGKQTFLGPGDFYRLTYPLFVSKAVYEGQRKTNPDKRVAILTRSAYAGQQRFGTINWSGDIGWDWDAFRRQITAGLNFSLTGMPYWTTDIGGFFRPGSYQYKSPEYHDILTRWFQFGAFNPVFRIHGYQSETEPWKYGETVENNMRKMLNLRYRLIPYIYSEAWKTSNKGSTMMRPLVMDFMDDNAAIDQAYQYMFGSALLVAPVTLPNAKQWDVYLPKASNWTDFWTNQSYPGGKIINVNAPQDRIPLFVKAGSVLVLGKEMQHTGESLADTLEVRIYPGANGSFELYEDEGDNYNYEEKQYTIIPFKWDDRKKTLLIGAIQGSFKGQLKNRVFNIIMVQPEQVEKQRLKVVKSALTYNGTSKKLKLN